MQCLVDWVARKARSDLADHTRERHMWGNTMQTSRYVVEGMHTRPPTEKGAGAWLSGFRRKNQQGGG
jgi:hypothetical protein